MRKQIVNAAWYALMGPLEVYGRITGQYRAAGPLPPYEVRNLDLPVRGPIIAFGDSLTAGYGAPKHQSYPAHLGRMLGVQVINRGRNGDTSRQGLDRIRKDVLPLRPGVVIVGFGGNDLMQRLPDDDCFSCLAEIVSALQQQGALVVLLGIRGSWLFKVDYASRFRRLAVETGCLLVPTALDGIWGYPWRMADAAHPNGRGYRLIAAHVATILAPILKTKDPKWFTETHVHGKATVVPGSSSGADHG